MTERAHVRALAVLHEDVRFTMPPQPGVWQGRDRVVQSWIDGGFGSNAFGSLGIAATSRWPLTRSASRSGALIGIVRFGPEVSPAFDLPRSI